MERPADLDNEWISGLSVIEIPQYWIGRRRNRGQCDTIKTGRVARDEKTGGRLERFLPNTKEAKSARLHVGAFSDLANYLQIFAVMGLDDCVPGL